jgi:cytochrome c biogenesis protein CcmG/thiol:disulfide interchange protein DsbE
MERKRRLGIAAVAAAVVIAAGVAVYETHRPSATPYPGHTAPDFALAAALSGETVSLSAYRGTPVVLNFWASWCGPCQSEQPLLTRAANTYRGRVQFVGVNVTASDDASQARAFVREHAVPYPVALDSKGTVAQLYQVTALPTTLFINRDGQIVDRVTGALDPAVLQHDLETITRNGGSTSQ